MHTVVAIGLGILSAMLYSLSFPPARLRFLAWFALVPLLLAVRRTTVGPALVVTWVFTVATAYFTGDWFPQAVAEYFDQTALVGVAFFFGVSTLMAAPGVIAFTALYRALSRRWATALPLLAAAAWVASELARARLLTGNPWVLLGYSQIGNLPLLQIADLAGVYGVSFVIAAVNAAITEICLSAAAERRQRNANFGSDADMSRTGWRTPWRAGLGFGSALLCVLFAWSYGEARLREAEASAEPGIPIAIAQANLDLGSQWRQELYGRNLDAYLRLTYEALQQGDPEIVVWPENALTFFLDQEPLYQASLARVLEIEDAQLVAGGPRFDETEASFYNSAFLIAANGSILGRYDKRHLLPFAEYFPLASLDFLRRNFGRVREFSAGEPSPPLATRAGAAGIVICNEALFPEIVAERVRSGAQYIINLSNDSWIPDAKFAEIAFNKVVLRAVEQRRYVIRASTSGPSAIIEPTGHVSARTEILVPAVLSGHIAARSALTPYARVGDLFAVACLVAAILGARTKSGEA